MNLSYMDFELWFFEVGCDNLCHTIDVQLVDFYNHAYWPQNGLIFLHDWAWVCLVYMWFFLELFVAFPNCLRFFSPVWSYVDFLWYMFPFHLWNSHILLDGHEIWHVITRHLKVHHGFSPIHLSYVVTDLWFIEVGACLVDFFEHVWTCLAFLIFISLLPMIQLSWNLVCLPCYGLCLFMIYLMIFGIVYDWFWVESCCWLLWASICHALT